MQEGRGGLPQSDSEAVKYYELAANQGYSDAQFDLVVMHRMVEVVCRRMIIRLSYTSSLLEIKAILLLYLSFSLGEWQSWRSSCLH